MKNILVIDDSALSRKMIIKALENNDFEIDIAIHGKEAFDKIKDNNKYDLIILDLLMPKMDGFQFLELMKKENYKIPVIVVSADIQKFSKQKCLELGALDFINKPIQSDIIINSINNILNN